MSSEILQPDSRTRASILPKGTPRIQPTDREIRQTAIPEAAWVDRFRGRVPLEDLRARIARENKLREVMLPLLTHEDGLADRRLPVRCLDAAFRLLGLRTRAMRNFEKIAVREMDWELPGLGKGFDGFRILHLSDFHLEFCPGLLDRIRRVIGELDYDLACLTGDYFDLLFEEEFMDRSALRELVSSFKAPVKAVLGNHDPLAVGAALEEAGARVFVNESEILERAGDRLFLAGLDDPRIYRAANFEEVMGDRPEGAASLVLVHSPQVYREAAEWGVSLTLCGHTHGGQVCLPFRIPIANKFQSPRRYMSGSWEFRGAQGYTSNGCGGCKLPYRLNAPAEVAVHTLRAGSGS